MESRVYPVSKGGAGGMRYLLRAIDEIAGRRREISGNLLGLAGGDILLQPLQEPLDLHRGRHLANPEVSAGLRLLSVPLDAKLRLFHEIGGEESSDSLHYPRMFSDIAGADSKLDDLCWLLFIHR